MIITFMTSQCFVSVEKEKYVQMKKKKVKFFWCKDNKIIY